MKKLFTLVLLLSSMFTKAQNSNDYFRIGDVRTSWSTQQASFDTVLFEVKPKGLFTEIGVYFDISTRGTTFQQGDSLEIQMSFRLPSKADITDMWLWIADSIVKADVYDKWTASQIYENIVKRRVDPAVLYKYRYEYWYYDYNYTYGEIEMYMLRIFPLLNDLPRKVKFTYLIPTEDLNSDNPWVNLPSDLLSLSYKNILNIKVRFFPDDYLVNPRFFNFPDAKFNQQGSFLEADLSDIDYKKGLSLNFLNKYNNKQFTGIYNKTGEENYYLINLSPNKIFELNKNKKGLFLFDFIEANCSSLKINQILDELKNKIHSNFTSKDSFNIMISGMLTKILSNKWLPADSLTIENSFKSIKTNDFNSYSGLPTLLIDGINFIKNNNGGSVILIASSNSNGSYKQANDLIGDYLSLLNTEDIPIHILDLDNINNSQEAQYINNHTYYGNEYLYINLSMLTIGEYYSLKQSSFNVMLSETFQKLTGYFTSMDIYISLENGYTYSNYDLSQNLGLVYIDQPIQKVGKFTGSGRFKAIVSAQMQNGEFLHQEFFIEQNDIIPMDSTVKTIWAANLLRVMRNYTQNNNTITQIINMSKKERILTDYTAFLALEPGIGILPDDGQDDNWITNVNNHSDDKQQSDLYISPNPASSTVNISYTLSAKTPVKILIYDIYGKIILSLDQGNKEAGKYTLTVDVSKLPQGTYFCKMNTNENSYKSFKLVIIH